MVAMASTGIDVDDVITQTAGLFLKVEMDRQIINLIRAAAGSPNADIGFDASMTGLTGITRVQKFQDFILKLSKGSNIIFNAAGRGEVSWIICGGNASTIVEAQKDFVRDANVIPIGAHIIGTLGGITTVIKDPGLPLNEYIIGFNGSIVGDAGIVMSMWIPLFFTPTLVTPDLKGGKALLSMYDVVVANGNYYVRGQISNY